MCFASSLPVIAGGKGKRRLKARSPEPLTASATILKTMPATVISVGERSRAIGAAGRSGSPPNMALTTTAIASGSSSSIRASGEESEAPIVMAWLPAPDGGALANRASSTFFTAMPTGEPSTSFSGSSMAGMARSAIARAASITRAGSPVSPTSRSMM